MVALLAPGLFPEALRGIEGRPAVYFEAAAVILVLVLVGQVMELAARDRTGDAIRALLDLAPKTARRIDPDGREEDVALGDLRRGDRLRVRPGEPVPVEKTEGSEVTGGTLNKTGGFVMEVGAI